MKSYHNISKEELDIIANYVDEENAPMPSPDAIFSMQSLFFSLQRKLTKEYLENQNRVTVLQHKLDNKEKRKARSEATGNISFTETGYDSVDVANTLLYCLQQVKTYRLTKTKVIYILYEMYSSWLYSKKERLFLEHPVCTEYGPQFWRVYNKINVLYKVPYEFFKNVAEKNPGIAAFCKNAAQKYYDYDEKTLKNYFTKSQPYANALPVHNNGKWNKELSDSDIFVWKLQTRG